MTYGVATVCQCDIECREKRVEELNRSSAFQLIHTSKHATTRPHLYHASLKYAQVTASICDRTSTPEQIQQALSKSKKSYNYSDTSYNKSSPETNHVCLGAPTTTPKTCTTNAL